MRFAILAAALALSPVAHAQDCSTLDALLDYGAKDEFEGILDEEVDDGVYEATITFPRSDACEVDVFATQYYCRWEAANAADADKAILPLYDMAKVCLSEGWAWDDIAGKTFGSDMTILEGYQMTKQSGAHKGAVVRVLLAAPANVTGRMVWLEIKPE